MAEFSIRKAVESDLEGIIQLWKQNIKTVNTASDIADLFHPFANYYFVAVAPLTMSTTGTEEKLIGFVGGAVRVGHGHISGIAVIMACRRRKVGEGLIKAVEHEFCTAAFDTVTLEVRPSNTGAMRFYEKQGYKPAYTVKRYYADGEDALVYAKKI
jgi:ribosomal protein S18 acetylase RimI-like enzyme